MKRLLVVAALAACGGGSSDKPTVTCKIKNGLECEVRQPDADAKYKVCWDFAAKCKNGSTFTLEQGCATVNGSIVTRATFTEDRIKVSGDCDEKVSEEIKNVTSLKQKDQ